MEKFAPYETVLEIKSAEGLNDTSLAATFPMHTGSPAASSNRLGEISEDAEDPGPAAPAQDSASSARTSSLTSRVRQRAQRQAEQRLQSERSPPPAIRVEDVQSKPIPEAQTATTPKKAHISQFLVRDDSGQRSITSLSSASTAPTSQFSSVETPAKPSDRKVQADVTASAPSAKPSTEPPITSPTTSTAPPVPPLSEKRTLRGVEMLNEKPPPEVRPISGRVERPITKQEVSSQTAAETSGKLTFDDDPYDFSRFDLKPKVKLGPRPVAATDKSKRPSMTGVASIPASHRPTSSKKPDTRPKSTGPMNVPALTSLSGVPAPPPIPEMPEYTPRPVSRGSIKSLPSHKSTAMTPDKIRLMKAVEHRKKQMRKSNPQPNFVPPPEDEVPAMPAVPKATDDSNAEKPAEADAPSPTAQTVDEQSPGKKADSGISMDDERDDTEAEKDAAPQKAEESATERAMSDNLETGKDSTPQKPEEPATEKPMPDQSAESTAIIPEDPPTSPAAKEVVSSPKIDTPRAAPQENAAEDESTNSITPQATANDVPASEEETAKAAGEKPSQGLGLELPAEEGASAVPTIIMADGTRPISSSENKESEDTAKLSPAISENRTEDDDRENENAGGSDLEPPEPQLHHKSSDIAKRRRGFVEPLNIEPDAEFSSDDEFMDELQTATVQEATPMTVSKSPLNSYFPRRPSGNSIISEISVKSVNINRASTLPVDFAEMQDRLSPDPSHYSPGRITSPSDERIDTLAAMRRNVSSGISRRIQALAEVSSRESINSQGSGSGRPISPETSRTVVGDYRDTRRSPPPHPSRASSMRAMHRQSARMSSYQTQLLASSRQPVDSNTVYSVQKDPETNRDSVSVSARIIRPAATELPSSDDAQGEMQQPQLVINHKRGPSQNNAPPQLHQIDTTPVLSQTSRPGSMSSRTMSPETTRSPVESRQLHSATRSRGHRPSTSLAGPSVDDFPAPPPTHISNSSPPAAEEPAQHSTRTSRFFKRMSNIGSKRKSTAPQSIASSASPASERGSVITANLPLPYVKDRSDAPPAVHVGDLNIQFPDSLVRPLIPCPMYHSTDTRPALETPHSRTRRRRPPTLLHPTASRSPAAYFHQEVPSSGIQVSIRSRP